MLRFVKSGRYSVAMTQPSWPEQVISVVAERIKHYRQERELSAQQLANTCKEIGYTIPRSVIANLESGRRETVNLPELLVLAQALGVPPILLIFPLGRADRVEVLPGHDEDTWRAVQWFTGEVPDGLLPGEQHLDGSLVNVFREHQRLLDQWIAKRRSAQEVRDLAAMQAKQEHREGKTEVARVREELAEKLAEADEQAAAALAEHLRAVRAHIQARGYAPPPLPASWSPRAVAASTVHSPAVTIRPNDPVPSPPQGEAEIYRSLAGFAREHDTDITFSSGIVSGLDEPEGDES